jgi:hypothetical protein
MLVTQVKPRALHNGKTELVKTSTVVNYVPGELELNAQKLASIKAKLSCQVSTQANALMQRVSPSPERFQLGHQRQLILKKLGLRTPADRKFLQDFDAKSKKLALVQSHAARLQAQIQKLTLTTAPSWAPSPFPGV